VTNCQAIGEYVGGFQNSVKNIKRVATRRCGAGLSPIGWGRATGAGENLAERFAADDFDRASMPTVRTSVGLAKVAGQPD
jgi:hypothetical protein